MKWVPMVSTICVWSRAHFNFPSLETLISNIRGNIKICCTLRNHADRTPHAVVHIWILNEVKRSCDVATVPMRYRCVLINSEVNFIFLNYLVAPDISACRCWLIPGPPGALCGDGGWPAPCLQAPDPPDVTPLYTHTQREKCWWDMF